MNNLIYNKSVFDSINGFENNNHIASGDDMFTLENFLNYDPDKVIYIPERDALIETKPVKDWSELIAQRIRWSSKSKYYNSISTKCIGLLVLITNFILLTCYVLVFTNPIYLFGILIKWSVDSLIILKVAHLFKTKKIYFLSVLISLIIYPFLTAVIAIKSLTSSYNWKGRQFRV